MRKFTIKKLSDTSSNMEGMVKYKKMWDIILGSSTKLEKGEDGEEYKENDRYTQEWKYICM